MHSICIFSHSLFDQIVKILYKIRLKMMIIHFWGDEFAELSVQCSDVSIVHFILMRLVFLK